MWEQINDWLSEDLKVEVNQPFLVLLSILNLLQFKIFWDFC